MIDRVFEYSRVEPHRRRLVVVIVFLVLGAFLSLPGTPAVAQTENENCFDCHDDPDAEADDGRSVEVVAKRFLASIHGDFECVDCHSQEGDFEDFPHWDTYAPVNCADCHDDVVEDYETSVHHLGRRGKQNGGGATCTSCHGVPHYTVASDDTASAIHHSKIPMLCAKCHTDQPSITDEYVRLPIALPSYYASVHGFARKQGNNNAAVCTDCHSPHRARIAQDPESQVNHSNVAATCSKCHGDIAALYGGSIHGQAAGLGILDAPTCTTCHDEHLLKRNVGERAKVVPEHRANELCGDCHTDPAMLTKYGITEDVVASYLDSYHAWAVDRGSRIAATCVDCHNVHDIRSTLDPESSVHPANVTTTCSRCHKGVGIAFATSYTHASALAARSVHGWVRLFYIGLIAVVLGGMALHNFIVARFELTRHFRKRRSEPYIQRWVSAERLQHWVLLLSFTGLAVTGFALRYYEAWWVQLIGLGGHESLRANLHRTFGVIMIGAAVYHIVWVIVTRRGRAAVGGMAPRINDVRQFAENIAFHLGRRPKRPAFGAFDYTQKAEYWAVVWGTWIMALTGLVLWYPTIATGLAPAWIVRVSEVIHFYEAILAVAAIFIWHFFYVIFLPSEYPMSTTWIDGRMPADEWREMHRAEAEAAEAAVKTHRQEPSGDAGDGPEKEV
jgi:formate dehydrogenase gamma subunit